MGYKASLALCALAWVHTNVLGMALPGSGIPNAERQSEIQMPASEPGLECRSFANGIPLRIMPLGASITHGVASSGGNGYREYLRDSIVASGNEVNMVGSNPNGTMVDNDNSGWPGLIIDEVHTKSNIDTPAYEPNLVLINLGTNDAIQNVDIENAGTRMNSLLTDIYAQSPQATIILSGLIRNADPTVQERGVEINAQYQSLAASLQAAGKPILYADMQGSNGPAVTDLAPDGIHPVDAGYQKMADIWLDAIEQADQLDFLQPAAENGIPDDGEA